MPAYESHKIEIEKKKVDALERIAHSTEKIWVMLVIISGFVSMALFNYLGNLHPFFKNWVS